MTKDNVNHPSHYTEGRAFEVIDVLEDWCGRAPESVLAGLQWNSLKYQGRVWDKANPLEDLKKSRWYLNRLIDKLEAKQVPFAATYEDVLEDQITSALEGNDPYQSDVDDQALGYWSEDQDYMWDPSLGPVELCEDSESLEDSGLSEEVIDWIVSKNPREDDIVQIIEKRGMNIAVKANGNTCVLNDDGCCE